MVPRGPPPPFFVGVCGARPFSGRWYRLRCFLASGSRESVSVGEKLALIVSVFSLRPLWRGFRERGEAGGRVLGGLFARSVVGRWPPAAGGEWALAGGGPARGWRPLCFCRTARYGRLTLSALSLFHSSRCWRARQRMGCGHATGSSASLCRRFPPLIQWLRFRRENPATRPLRQPYCRVIQRVLWQQI